MTVIATSSLLDCEFLPHFLLNGFEICLGTQLFLSLLPHLIRFFYKDCIKNNVKRMNNFVNERNIIVIVNVI